ncbi:MAG TPA: DUF1697 domain-containing protein, partial [Magnetospirillum sp.]|nr:DUF1697 domain-containing protein [Magnetospirillum sp.]
VGGTGKLAMSDLRALCQDAGFQNVRTYIASGNVVFTSPLSEQEVKETLEVRLRDHAGTPIGAMVRTAAEMAAVLAHNPFLEAPEDRVVAIFLDSPASSDLLSGVTGQAEDEQIRIGCREIYVWYGHGQGNSKLRIPAAKAGTARNMNTIAKLAEMAAQ